MKFYIVNLHNVRWPLDLNKAMGGKRERGGQGREQGGGKEGGKEKKRILCQRSKCYTISQKLNHKQETKYWTWVIASAPHILKLNGRRLAWPLGKDDWQICEAFHIKKNKMYRTWGNHASGKQLPPWLPAAADIAETLLLLLSLNSSQGVNLPSDPTQAFLALATNFIVWSLRGCV